MERGIDMLPVLIVGAGAAGTMLALELARQGIEYRLVDRLPGPSTHSRAVTVHARTLEILGQIDPVLLARFLELGRHSPGYVMHYVGKDGIRREVRPGLDFRQLASNHPFLLLNAQNDSEALLRDYLAERYDIRPEWGLSCSAVELAEDSVLATLVREDGSEERLEARYLVACDGANSRIRRQLGLIQEGSDYAGTVLQNLDIGIEGFPDDPDWVHYCMGPGHFVMVVKLPRGFFRLLMSQPAEQADAEATPQEVFAGILGRHFDGLRFGETIWHSRWQSFNRLAERYRSGNVFLAGDAAHIHSTAGGQGMNCCMQDAWNLGWKLALVLRGTADPKLLDSYESERKPIGAQVIDAASQIHELFMAGRSSTPAEVLELQRSGKLSSLVDKVSGLAYHYRSQQEALPDSYPGLPRDGDRAPDAVLPGGGRVSAHLQHTGFTLLAMLPQGADAEQCQAAVERIAAQAPTLLRVAVLAPAPAAYIGEATEALLYLIRPDGYIALRTTLEDQQQLTDWLAAMMTGN